MTMTTNSSPGLVVGEPLVDGSVAPRNDACISGIPSNPSDSITAHDTTPTPPISDPGATDLAANPLEGKALNAVITPGVGNMHTYCVELQTDHFFDSLLPGPDPSSDDLATFTFPKESALNGLSEWEVNVEIVSDLKSVYSSNRNLDHLSENSVQSRPAF